MKAVVPNKGAQMVTRMLTPVSLRGGGGTGKLEHRTPPLKAPAVRLCTHPEVKPRNGLCLLESGSRSLEAYFLSCAIILQR